MRQPMDDGSSYLTLSEVRGALNRLRAPEIVRLSLLAQHWARGLRRHDQDDMMNEAFDRVLSGRRPWPSDVPLPAFLSGVMRSIASQWRREDWREPLLERDEQDTPDGTEHDLTAGHEFNDLLFRMRQVLADDPEASGVLNHVLDDTDRAEAQSALSLDATSYDTARRRMVRKLIKVFGPEWDL